MDSQVKTFHIFYNQQNKRAVVWAGNINKFIKDKFPNLKSDVKKPDAVIVLGGDGTILDAARKYHEQGSIILGLNLGNVGFLASAREENSFLNSLDKFFRGDYSITERMMISIQVKRKRKIVFNGEALNEVAITNVLGMVELEAKIAGHSVKHIVGTGMLVATATGSTAYNLSAHGPIVMPDIKCFILTELLDHSIPSPSLVIKYNNEINIGVVSYRERGLISLSETGKKLDVILSADGESVFPLEEKDEIIIKNSPHLIKFAELEEHYFFKSLKEKFGFK